MNPSRRSIAILTGQFLLGSVLRTSLAAGSPSAGIDAASFVRLGGGLRAAMAPSDQAWLQSLHVKAAALMASDPQDFQNVLDGMDFSAAHVLADQLRFYLY
jgi:hypothetical protein